MALQGTLDTFELPDVLRLLASTRKTGQLQLRTDRGIGAVWLADGDVVSVSSSGAVSDDTADGLFDLLRAHGGTFSFDAGAAPEGPSGPVEPLLAAAETRLVEWREIESVVPSLDAWVALAPELPGPALSIDAATWRLVAAVGSGTSVRDLGAHLGLAEVPVCRVVRDLVSLGIGVVSSAMPEKATPEPRWEPPVFDEPAPLPEIPEPAADSFPEPAPEQEPEPFRFASVAPEVDVPDDHDERFVPRPPVAADRGPNGFDEDDEVARQLAMLSPQAAQAVAIAAAAGTEEERDAALAAIDESEETVNRGLLMKFLSSVKS